jgi:spore coat polysaccharide biosynthesis protein SpsF
MIHTGYKVVCITQARTTSKRLPRKVLLEVYGQTLLAHHLGRLQRSSNVDEVVLATTVNTSDDEVAELGAQLGVSVVRGSEVDVLSRFVMAAQASQADVIVRVTSDCPLIDPTLIDQAVQVLLQHPNIDYVHLDMTQFPRGLDVEVFHRSLLDTADQDPETSPFDREHVTPYIYKRPKRFHLYSVTGDMAMNDWRWCVDESADFELIKNILLALLPTKPFFTWQDCAELMRQHPEWNQINQHVRQTPSFKY